MRYLYLGAIVAGESRGVDTVTDGNKVGVGSERSWNRKLYLAAGSDYSLNS
jgi:hypothetical protein